VGFFTADIVIIGNAVDTRIGNAYYATQRPTSRGAWERRVPNVHSPERQPGESQEQYRSRQRLTRYQANLGRSAETGEPVFLKGIGDQHKAPSQRQQMRDNARSNGRGPKGVFGAGIVAAVAKKLRDSKAHQAKHPLRDAHGALTLIGSGFELIGVQPTSRDFVISGGQQDGQSFHGCRRIWLAGISAQRGF
jgi:hypothetical protein